MKIGILGGGFGIYGYLPASLSLGWTPYLPIKYREIIVSRVELSQYLSRINFVPNEVTLLEESEALVVARTPLLQYELVSLLQFPMTHLFLEKPLAPDSDMHRSLLALLENRSQNFSVAYIFQETDWYMSLVNSLKPDSILKIEWQIRKPLSNWKDLRPLGGGLLDYYALHFGPLLTKLSLTAINLKLSILPNNSLRIESLSGIQVDLVIAYGAQSSFVIEVDGSSVWRSSTPFGDQYDGIKDDPRVPFLASYLTNQVNNPSLIANLETERFILSLRDMTQF